VAQISTARKAGVVAGVAARQVRRNRWVRGGVAALTAVCKSAGRVAHLLWLEITGLFFLLFSLVGIVALSREYPRYQSGRLGAGKLVLTFLFTVVFGYFGVSSFWRASRKGER
jgi:hypothetical protein